MVKENLYYKKTVSVFGVQTENLWNWLLRKGRIVEYNGQPSLLLFEKNPSSILSIGLESLGFSIETESSLAMVDQAAFIGK